jgi:hypothetical protein
MGPLPTVQAAVRHIAHLVRIATRQHLGRLAPALAIGLVASGIGLD